MTDFVDEVDEQGEHHNLVDELHEARIGGIANIFCQSDSPVPATLRPKTCRGVSLLESGGGKGEDSYTGMARPRTTNR